MSNQKVSIITPVFNSENYIADAIDSALNQTYKDLELIIIDDHSQDRSVEIVKNYVDSRIQLICLKKNGGAGLARNRGIEIASGRYIAFLDADDMWASDKLEKQLDFMGRNKISFCYSSFYLMNDQGASDGTYIEALPRVNHKKMLKNNYIGCLTAIYDTESLGKVYMTEHKKRQDWGLWLKLLSKTPWAMSLSEPLAYYRHGNTSLSKNKLKLIRENYLFYHNQLGFSTILSVSRMTLFIFYYFQYKIMYTKAT